MAWGLRKAYVIRLSLYRLYFEFISKTFKLYMSGKTSSTCWRAKCGKTASVKIFYTFYVHNLCLVQILVLRYGLKFSLPIRLQHFYKNEISRTNLWIFFAWYFCMLKPIQKKIKFWSIIYWVGRSKMGVTNLVTRLSYWMYLKNEHLK